MSKWQPIETMPEDNADDVDARFLQAAQSVPVVGEPVAWSQYAFSQNGLSSCAGSNSLVIGTSNTCSHNDCLVIGTHLTTTKHGQVLIGNKEVHQTGDISPEELSVFKDILLKTRYPAHSIAAAKLATLREKAARLEQVEKERDEANARLHDVSVACATAEQEREELRKDAERYRWLREQYWNSADICVVRNPKEAVKLGHDCPSFERLDSFIDAAIAQEGE